MWGVLKIQLFLFNTSFHAVGLAGLFPPREARGRLTRSAWQAHAKRVASSREARGKLTRSAWQVRGNDKRELNF